MSLKLAIDLLQNDAFLRRCRSRIIDRLVLGNVDPERDPNNDPIRNTLKDAVIDGQIGMDAMVMAMFVVDPQAAIAAVSDPANPGAGLSDQRLDEMIMAAWEKIVELGL